MEAAILTADSCFCGGALLVCQTDHSNRKVWANPCTWTSQLLQQPCWLDMPVGTGLVQMARDHSKVCSKRLCDCSPINLDEEYFWTPLSQLEYLPNHRHRYWGLSRCKLPIARWRLPPAPPSPTGSKQQGSLITLLPSSRQERLPVGFCTEKAEGSQFHPPRATAGSDAATVWCLRRQRSGSITLRNR